MLLPLILIQLHVNTLNIADLTGIEDFIALTELICHINQLTSLNISQNTALIGLSCSLNQLSSLDVSQNTSLTQLGCFNNQIINLDLSQNTLLTLLLCSDNQLTSLNVKNGNNINMSSSTFLATNNPNLTCIEVDDAAWSAVNWANIDATSTFVNNQAECNALSIDNRVLQNVSIYPNPVKSKLYVQAEAEVNYKLFSITGKLVLKGKINQIHQFIDVSKINKGMYFIKLEIDNKNLTKKIIIN